MTSNAILLRDSVTKDVLSGEWPAGPIIRIKPTAARAAPVETAGWRWARGFQVVNNGDEALNMFPYAFDLGNTSSTGSNLVALSKAQADADDVRVWSEGREVGRVLVDWNSTTHTTLCWIVIDSLPAGQSQQYWVVYGNSLAPAPPSLLAFSRYPAFDIVSIGANRSSNALWKYKVDDVAANAGLGLWPLSSGVNIPDYNFVAPGAWIPAATNPGWDDASQPAWSSYVDAGTKYQAIFNATRARGGSTVLSSGIGADGVRLHHPVGITSVTTDFKITNQAIADTSTDPVGRLVVLGKRIQGQDWFKVFEYATLQAVETTIASSAYNFPTNTRDVALAVWPLDNIAVNQAARSDRKINAKSHTTLDVALSTASIAVNTVAEFEIYELANEISYGGGAAAALLGERQVFRVGNFQAASGEGTPREFVSKAANEQIVVDSNLRSAEVWNSTFTTKVRDLHPAAYSAVETIYRGNDAFAPVAADFVEQPDPDWLFVLPNRELIKNPDFDADVLNWTSAAPSDPLMTVSALAWSNAGTLDDGGYATATIGPNTSGAGTYVEYRANEFIPIGDRKAVWLGVSFYTANVNIQVNPAIWFYATEVGTQIGSVNVPADFTVAAINTWYRRLFATLIPANATHFKVGVQVKSKTSSQTGAFRFDTLKPLGPEIVVRDANLNPGTLDVQYQYRPRFAYA